MKEKTGRVSAVLSSFDGKIVLENLPKFRRKDAFADAKATDIPMRFLHTSDCHIDSPLTAHLSGEKLRERKQELFTVFLRMMEDAQRLGAAGVLIAGDLFDSEHISRRSRARIFHAMEKAKTLSFFYLPGNHERTALLGDELPQNLFVFDTGWTRFDLGDVSVLGRSTLSADMFDTLPLDRTRKNIVLLHGEWSDGHSSAEKIGLADAVGRGIDYLALGHYHTCQQKQLDARTLAAYSGTPEGRGFDEVGEKGYLLLDTDDTPIRVKFCPCAKRRMQEISVCCTEEDTPASVERRAEEALAGVPSCDLVRLLLTGDVLPDTGRDTLSLSHGFEHRFYYFEIRDERKMRLSFTRYKNDKSLKGEFIRMILADPSLSDGDRGEIIETGLAALSGEPLDT